ncbi:MAG: hypothetical protein JOZ58_20930 [Acetobacteraceae bacterium]|nr:hypothetical protein [Acetobacteraceae bacterium]
MGKLDGKVRAGNRLGPQYRPRDGVEARRGRGHVDVNARSNQAEADAVAREARERGIKALAVIADVAKKIRSTRWWRARCPNSAGSTS